MRIEAVHQFHPDCTTGDDVAGCLFFTRRLLRDLGFKSDIYGERVPPDLVGEIKSPKKLKPDAGTLLLVHHSALAERSGWLDRTAVPKILVHHNSGRTHLSSEINASDRHKLPSLQRLKQRVPAYLGAVGYSENCSAELREAGYASVVTIPLLVDVEHIRHVPWNPAEVAPLRNSLNLLCVGSICESERQLELIEVLSEFLHFAEQPVRLILAGDMTSAPYRQRIEDRIHALGLESQVVLAGKVPNSTLLALYRHADTFVSMREAEDFCVPQIQAMSFDVPVVTPAGRNMLDALNALAESGGVSQEGPRAIAALLHLLLTEPALRRRVITGQHRDLQRLQPDNLRQQLADYLGALGVDVAHPSVPLRPIQRKPYWQIEGPFDSSYSLAIVNRELGRALAKRGNEIGLRSMEGAGEFVPSAAFLEDNPDCAVLAQRAKDTKASPDAALRFCYPPHVDDMRGNVRVIHSYGWEETGFPAEYVAAFNRKLDLVTVLSKEVEKILRDNGVRIPIAVTGAGVDHLLTVTGQPPVVEMRAFRFLHISSCFPRKGVDALLWAYGKAFRKHDDVSLVIKTFPNPHNDVAYQIERLREQDPGYPHVVLIDHESSQSEVVGLYAACHAFVAPSRGEGFGLPLAEAMFFNLPVITTGWGGQLDFCDASTAWLCNYEFAKSETHLGQTHSVWADPDVAHLAQLMREVHQLAPEQRARRTDVARKKILRDFTWDRVAQRTEQAIHALAEQPVLRNEPRIGWISTWNKRCGIAAYSSFLTVAIPDDRLVVLADRVSERTADDRENVVRCWEIDPNETLDETYDAIIAHGIGTVVIQYNFGFFPLMAFGRLIERLKQVGVSVHCFFHATGDLLFGGQQFSLGSIANALAKADRLYVHSVLDLNRLKKHGLVRNVTFFPQGVLPVTTDTSDAEREAHGLQGKKIIAAYGFLLPHKGIQDLIRAFGQLADEDETLHLLLVNALYPVAESEQEKDACVSLIETMGLKQRVTLITDFLPEAQCLALLRMADCIVYPYLRTQESSSAAARMGLATGKPVVVTPLSIFDDISDAVHTLSNTDVESIAAGVRQLLNDPAAIARQAEKTSQWLASRQWPLLSVRLLNLIDGIANPLPSHARHI